MSSERITTGLNQPAIRYTLTFVEIDDPRILYSTLNTLNEIAGYRIHVVDKFTDSWFHEYQYACNDTQYMIAVGREGHSISEQSLYTFRLSTFNSAGLSKVLLGEVEERSDAVLEAAAYIAGNKSAPVYSIPQFSSKNLEEILTSDPDPLAEVGKTVKDLAALSEAYYNTVKPVIVSVDGVVIGKLYNTDVPDQLIEAKLLAARKKVDVSNYRPVVVPDRVVNFVSTTEVDNQDHTVF